MCGHNSTSVTSAFVIILLRLRLNRIIALFNYCPSVIKDSIENTIRAIYKKYNCLPELLPLNFANNFLL